MLLTMQGQVDASIGRQLRHIKYELGNWGLLTHVERRV